VHSSLTLHHSLLLIPYLPSTFALSSSLSSSCRPLSFSPSFPPFLFISFYGLDSEEIATSIFSITSVISSTTITSITTNSNTITTTTTTTTNTTTATYTTTTTNATANVATTAAVATTTTTTTATTTSNNNYYYVIYEYAVLSFNCRIFVK
jgi:hypothetical protein